ncbi:glutamate receptor ionotropic, delta-2-like [Daphnia pulex]|uniref:glutamate receptor ionotropic, delta-2-like n=1 Tax=Daphnia pulex TaxID=6669 RepID=UPI001EDDE2D6|nr:glutamate receptor ionotropic, delta-2-like [Daphnia pulex]XP_046461749.1 glutamate receptor ionotropic, delta-2-like [Daphnia pulex]
MLDGNQHVKMKATRVFPVFYVLLHSLVIASCDWKVGGVPEGTASQLSKPRNHLQGKELQIVAGHFPPPIVISRNSSGQVIGYSGVLVHQLLYLSQSLKFTYKIFPAAVNTNGVKINGTWNGIIGTLLREEADLGLVPVAISLERYQAIDFCGLVGGDFTGLLVKYPTSAVSYTATIDVFTIGTWFGFIICATVIAGFYLILTFMAKKLLESLALVERIAANARVVANGGGSRFGQWSQHLLLFTWSLVAFVFVKTYTSTLTSHYLSTIYKSPEINTFADLAASTTYKATVGVGSIQEIDLLMAKTGDLKRVADNLSKCPDCRKFSLDELALPVLEKDHYVAITPTKVGRALMQKYSSERGHCRLTMAKELFSWKPMYFAVPKSSPYQEEINRESLWFHAAGLHDYWYFKLEKFPRNCQLNYNNKGVVTKRSSRSRLKLQQFYLPFLILFSGFMLAIVQFCRERFIHSR